MEVTRFKYSMEKGFIKKLDAMIERCESQKRKRDAVLIVEGPEGEGKTTFSAACGMYISEKTGRPFSDKNLFFDIEEMIKFAKENSKQIIVWDEPALQALSGDHASKIVRDLKRLLMMARKKRHFFLINITYFHKFNDYIIVDRPCGLVHIYTRKSTDQARFVYIPEKNLPRLWDDWRRSKKRNYFKYSSKLARGTFSDILNEDYKKNILSSFDIDAYEERKDEAIAQIGEKKSKKEVEVLKFKYGMYLIAKRFNLNKKEVGEIVDAKQRTVYDWGQIPEKHPEILAK